MGDFLKNVLTVVAFIPLLKGNPRMPTNDSTICGNWIIYNNENCMKVLDMDDPRTQEEAKNACRYLSSARLVTVKTSEKQKFLHQFLLESEISESVWLGLEENKNGKQLEWNDGSDLKYNNLMKSNGSGHQCVEMNKAGLWVLVGCHKKNIAVCEIDLKGALQNEQRNAKPMELEKKINQSENDCDEKILKSEKKTDLLKEATEKTIDLLKEAKERIDDIEQSDEPKLVITYERSNANSSLEMLKESKICGEWTPYKDEKCMKFIEKAGFQTNEEAQVVCQAFAEEFSGGARLLTIRSKEEQQFVQWLLFVKNEMLDNVWLGQRKKGPLFEWSDGSELVFTNWATQSRTDDQQECVEMGSGDGALATGLWLTVSCKRRNAVICERRPAWTLETLQESFMNFKVELKQKLAHLQSNPVPIDFIYVQLPSQPPPITLWPMTKWAEVSSNYSGLFFRVVGDQAAPFGQIQEGNSPRLAEVERINDHLRDKISIPSNGSWSEQVLTGSHDTAAHRSLRFRLSVSEVRPRNQAVRIWKRIE